MILIQNFDNFLKNIHLLIIILLPITLVSGPFLTDLTVVISSLLFIYFSLIEKKYYYYLNKFFIIFLIWCFYLILTSLLSENILLSLESSLFYFRFGFFSLSIWYLLDENKNFLKYFLTTLFIVYLIFLGDSIIQFFYERNILGYEYKNNRLSSFFGDEKKLGSYLSRLMPLLCLFIIYKKKINIFILIFLIGLITFVVFLTGERTAILLYALSLFILIFSIKKSFFKKILIFSSFVLFSIVLIFSIENIYKRVISETYNSLFNNSMKFDFENKVYLFSKFHQKCYEISIVNFLDKPFIGIGPKISRYTYDKIDQKNDYKNEKKLKEFEKEINCSTHPHNYYFQLLSETGILGITPVIILFLLVSYQIFKNMYLNIFYNKEYLKIHLLSFYACLFLTLFPLVPSGNFFNNWMSAVHFLPFGFIAYFQNKK